MKFLYFGWKRYYVKHLYRASKFWWTTEIFYYYTFKIKKTVN